MCAGAAPPLWHNEAKPQGGMPRMAEPASFSTTSAADDAPRRLRAGRLTALESGDRLTRCEFERRYAARPDLRKAELIEGVVYLPSPARSASHAEAHYALIGWLTAYSVATPGVRGADNATVRLDLDNEPQPDALLRIERRGGRSRLGEDDYIEGAPELVVEVAASSAAIDLHDKLRAYRRNGVQEYLVWRTGERRIDWYALVEGDYRPLPRTARGVLHSSVFPGLRLAAEAMLRGDLAAVLAEQRRGLRTRKHREFVARLASSEPQG